MESTKREPLAAGAEALQLLLRGTAGATGEEFLRALVRNLAEVLGTSGAWVTEYLPESQRLRALAFWLNGEFVPDYSYAIEGTPCAEVVGNACLVHIPERVVELYPRDGDLRNLHAVSYLGVPLLDPEGGVMGHLSALDSKPMPESPELVPLFELFAERAAAECRRLRAEGAIREREELLCRILDTASDAILVFDPALEVHRANPAAEELLGGAGPEQALSDESLRLLRAAMERIEDLPGRRRRLWVPGLLEANSGTGRQFRAEATLSRFDSGGAPRYTLILRDLRERIEVERRMEELAQEAEYLREAVREVAERGEMLGRSPAMLRVFDAIARVAPAETTVLIEGETGTGKELVARAIHQSSRRATRRLVRVNCAAVPHNLMESEFFGHERGAFTGATQRREGRFSVADGGTIFLDEVGELPLDLQAKFLRVLQEGEFEPLGSSRTTKVNVRVVAATNRDLAGMVREGTFREDLYYRLGVFPVRLPPLRERGNDVVVLAGSIAQRIARQMGRQVDPLGPEDVHRLKSYHWPGNVRELQNVVERAIILARGARLDLVRAMPEGAAPSSPPPPEDRNDPGEQPILTEREMRGLERGNLLRALEACRWRVAGGEGAARLLGLAPSTVASRMKALGIRPPGRPAG